MFMETLMAEKTFADELRARRLKAGLTLDELAAEAGMSRVYINTIELGKIPSGKTAPAKPSRRIVESLAAALNWPVEDALIAAGYVPLASQRSGGHVREDRLTYEPVMDGAGFIIVSTAGVAPGDRPKLKKLIDSLVENFQEEENLTTFGRRVADDDEETE